MADLDKATFDHMYSTRQSNQRRLSYASQTSGGVHASAFGSSGQQLTALSSKRGAWSETDQSEIYSPIPRRHYLIQTESHEWLRGDAFSSASSPPVSPTSSVSALPASPLFPKRHARRENTPRSSFLYQQETAAAGLAEQHKPLVHFEKAAGGEEAGAGRRWIKWMHRNKLDDRIAPCAIAAALLVKSCVALGGYSGAGIPPMYGDYEAQRHWMEITNNIPIRQWYTYDLEYWGLDYPPLSAYHSWLCGLIGSWIEPSWFALYTSRGIESPESKLYMRITVLISDLVVYVPALLYFVRAWHGIRSKRTQSLALLCLLFQPSLILIDSGHFQYNSVMLGFTLLALNCFSYGSDELGAVFFVASLGFKQMALYYAPAIGSYLLSRCILLGREAGSRLFLRLAITTVASFLITFLPFLPPLARPGAILDPISRIFPFARGLFEDKVANFWCASNVVFKWRKWLSQPTLIELSALFTALGFLPSSLNVIYAGWKCMTNAKEERDSATSERKQNRRNEIIAVPTLPILPWAMLSSSLSFFLFSFQVHEKTILLSLLPLNLLLSGAAYDSFTFNWGVLVNNVAVFSLWPLLERDGVVVPYFALTILWNYILGYNPLRKSQGRYLYIFSIATYTFIFSIHMAEILFSPTQRYPDLYPMLNVLISTPIFVLTWLWSLKRTMEVAWGVYSMNDFDGYSKTSSSSSASVGGGVRRTPLQMRAQASSK